jgi:TonB family protein
MLELNQNRPVGHPQARKSTPDQQPRKLLLALILLLVALVAVLIMDRQFWFGSQQATIDNDVPETQAAQQAAPATKPAVAPPVVKKATSTRSSETKSSTQSSTQPKPADTPVVERTPLAPLDVEVVAGNNHRTVHPGSNAARVETEEPANPNFRAATNAAEREPVTAAALHAPEGSYKAYPVLAQHMNVQGAVVLQALISAEGVVQNMKVLSGPAILASAAEQAVSEWRFKPIMQNGQAVESKAKITVNFTIKVADSSTTDTLAETRSDEIFILSR